MEVSFHMFDADFRVSFRLVEFFDLVYLNLELALFHSGNVSVILDLISFNTRAQWYCDPYLLLLFPFRTLISNLLLGDHGEMFPFQRV